MACEASAGAVVALVMLPHGWPPSTDRWEGDRKVVVRRVAADRAKALSLRGKPNDEALAGGGEGADLGEVGVVVEDGAVDELANADAAIVGVAALARPVPVDEVGEHVDGFRALG